jgi:hypothetical protein
MRTAMIAITTSNSINVNPRRVCFMGFPVFLSKWHERANWSKKHDPLLCFPDQSCPCLRREPDSIGGLGRLALLRYPINQVWLVLTGGLIGLVGSALGQPWHHARVFVATDLRFAL